MENMYNEHEASTKNGNAFAKMGNGHTDSHADKVLLKPLMTIAHLTSIRRNSCTHA